MLRTALKRAKGRAAPDFTCSPTAPHGLPAPLSDVNDERHGLRQALRGMGLSGSSGQATALPPAASSTPATAETAPTLGEDAAKVDGKFLTDSSQHSNRPVLTVEQARLPTQKIPARHGKPTIRVLYLFSGTDRKASIAGCLKDLCLPKGYGVEFWEVDIHIGGSSHDLLDKEVQEDFLSRIASGEFDMVILFPPLWLMVPRQLGQCGWPVALQGPLPPVGLSAELCRAAEAGGQRQ